LKATILGSSCLEIGGDEGGMREKAELLPNFGNIGDFAFGWVHDVVYPGLLEAIGF